MKFSILATVAAAIGLAAFAEAKASSVNVYSKTNFKGQCKNAEMYAYDQCYSTQTNKNIKSFYYHHQDDAAKEVTVTLYETGTCGGKWTRAGFSVKKGFHYGFGSLQVNGGKVGSMVLHKGRFPNGSGVIKQKLPAQAAKFTSKCTI
ncbi:hypothetical protein BGZ75_007411 [Mortierella antarctica]|nr:hypothetical protein BGZ67_000017 [Mortierella alpina]KAF9989156.1 hypothetical protein BGZ75_007411 [Mortierella antarctica]